MTGNVRNSGFSLPLNLQQIASWVVSSFNLLMSAVIYMPTLPLESQVMIMKVAFGIIFYISQFLVVVFAIIATVVNPADPFVKAKLMSNEPVECEIGQSICTICNSVISNQSKHCGTCNKCVDAFDHHCKWLNNCIGVQNYKYFIALLWSLEINILILIIFAIVLFSEYQNNYSDFDSRVQNPQVYIAFVALTFIDALVVLIGCSYLIIFHTYLKCRGISTFDFILLKREQKELKEKQTREENPHRAKNTTSDAKKKNKKEVGSATPSDNSRDVSPRKREKKEIDDIVIKFED